MKCSWRSRSSKDLSACHRSSHRKPVGSGTNSNPPNPEWRTFPQSTLGNLRIYLSAVGPSTTHLQVVTRRYFRSIVCVNYYTRLQFIFFPQSRRYSKISVVNGPVMINNKPLDKFNVDCRTSIDPPRDPARSHDGHTLNTRETETLARAKKRTQ